MAEYVNQGMLSIGYHATTDQHVHYTNIVHNFRYCVSTAVSTEQAVSAEQSSEETSFIILSNSYSEHIASSQEYIVIYSKL